MPVPVDLFDHVAPDDYSRYLKLPVKTEWDSYSLIAIFNEDDAAYNALIDFKKAGINPDKAHRIYEFWTEKYCGTYKEKFEYIIPPNSCRLFRISEARNYPWLLSSDMHIQQGYTVLGWHVPAIGSDDDLALDVLATVLGTGRSSRLYRGAIGPEAASTVTAFNWQTEEVGIFR